MVAGFHQGTQEEPKRGTEMNTKTTKTLAEQYAAAKNYAFEASMNDYSIESIQRATQRSAELREQVIAEGLDPETAVEWNGTKWVAAVAR